MTGRYVVRLALIVGTIAAMVPVAHAAGPNGDGVLSLSGACVVADAGQPRVQAAARLLARRLKARGIADGSVHTPKDGASPCAFPIRLSAGDGLSEGFTITRAGKGADAAGLVIRATMTRGEVYAAGWLLSHLSGDTLAWSGPIRQQPAFSVRGDQIGIRDKNNSFDAWTPRMLRRHVEDLALEGANRIQIIGPVSDDASQSALAPVPAIDAILATARAAHELGLDVALYQPLLGDYTKSDAVQAQVESFTRLIDRFPALDAVYFPGGDPGHTAPGVLFPLLKKLSVPLRRRWPKSELLVSSQGFDEAGFEAFVAQVRKRPKWLTGVFVGPQTRATIARHRALMGDFVPLELYPDTAHAMHAQLPVQHWAAAFALTEGREPVNPRPAAMRAAFARQSPGTRGFVAYSEGINDDWNLAEWLALAWNPHADGHDIALRYARLFIGDDRFAGVPAALENNWHGDPAFNRTIAPTLRLVDTVHPARWADWRIDLYRYRAVYDALVARRWRAARAAREQTVTALRSAAKNGPLSAASRARAAMDIPASRQVKILYARLEHLALVLWNKARMQLSVPLYGASNWERGANLDRAMIDLTDRAALAPRIAAALALPDRRARMAALLTLGDRPDARQHALYDDLGNADKEPHLVRGEGERMDPQARRSAIDGVADHLPSDGWALPALTYAEALYEHPLELRYTGLSAHKSWCFRYTWAGEGYWRDIELSANGHVVQPFHHRVSNPAYEQVAIPSNMVRDGTLTIQFSARPSAGGSGRGRQIAETWLIALPAADCRGAWSGPGY